MTDGRSRAGEPTTAPAPAGPWSLPPWLGGARNAVARLLAGTATLTLAVWLMAPLVWVAIVSTQADINLQFDPPRLQLPLLLEGYRRLVADPAWQAAALVSITVTTGATLLSLAIAALTAYPLARYQLRGGRSLLLALLGSQLIPPIALAIPVLFIFIRLELRNTILGMILINTAFWTPILVWLVRGAFLAVPRNLDLAARIDGSSRVGVIFRVMLPAAAPAIAAAAAIVFVGIWNDFVFAAVLGGRDTYTLPRYLGTSFTPSFHVLATKMVLTVAPCIVIIALLRRRILRLV